MSIALIVGGLVLLTMILIGPLIMIIIILSTDLVV